MCPPAYMVPKDPSLNRVNALPPPHFEDNLISLPFPPFLIYRTWIEKILLVLVHSNILSRVMLKKPLEVIPAPPPPPPPPFTQEGLTFLVAEQGIILKASELFLIVKEGF